MMRIAEIDLTTNGKILSVGRMREEWYQDVENPDSLMRDLKKLRRTPDIFTFWQRLPNTEPKYKYHQEWDSIAVLPITTYEQWWKHQISGKTRNMVRKAEKKGVETRITQFNDDFVRGIVEIFNETPVRQGKGFWHYGKDFDAVKSEFSRNVWREEIIGAYYDNRLVGFIMLADAGRYCMTTQIISKIGHRDKSPTNALLAKAVQRCAERGVPSLVYASWNEGSLGAFKRYNGFQRVDLPRSR